MSMPPNTTVLRSLVYLAYRAICWATWSASSRVGSSTRARTGWRAGEVELFSCLSRRCSRAAKRLPSFRCLFGRTHHVPPRQHDGNGLCLDGRHGFVAHFGYGAR